MKKIKFENNHPPRFRSTFDAPYIALLGSTNLLQPLSHLQHACKPSIGFTCHLQLFERPLLHYFLPFTTFVFLHSQCLLLAAKPFNLQVITYWFSHSNFYPRYEPLLSCSSHQLTLLEATKRYAYCSLFYKQCRTTILKEQTYLYNFQLTYLTHLLVE